MVLLKGKTIMASAPDPQHHSPDFWQTLIWALQQGWLFMVVALGWLFNKLYSMLFDKRNSEVDAKFEQLVKMVADLTKELSEVKEQLAEMRGEMRAEKKK